MTTLDDIQQAAEAATPGPWCEHPNGTSVWAGATYEYPSTQPRDHLLNATSLDEAAVKNVVFVATCNPATALAMVKALRVVLDFRETDAAVNDMLHGWTEFDAAMAELEKL